MPDLFDKHGGFRKLHSFTLATIVQLDTLRFCRRFLSQDPREGASKFYDPKGRQYDHHFSEFLSR
jgi:restriction system protein